MQYRDIVNKVASLYADRFLNVDHVHDIIVTMNESFDKPVEQIRTDIFDLVETIEDKDDGLGCDWCGVHIENGGGYYVADDRICASCMITVEDIP